MGEISQGGYFSQILSLFCNFDSCFQALFALVRLFQLFLRQQIQRQRIQQQRIQRQRIQQQRIQRQRIQQQRIQRQWI